MGSETNAEVKVNNLNDRCCQIYDIVGSTVRTLREIAGGQPEPQTDQQAPDGTLAVLEQRVDDLEYMARKALELAQEVQKRV